MQQFVNLISVVALVALGGPSPVGSGPSFPPNRAELGGIIVVGQGVVRIPADTLHLEVRFFSRGSVQSIDSAGQSIAETMRANGVSDARWTLSLSGVVGGNSSGAIVGTIRKPTRDNVEAMARKMAATLPNSLAGTVQNFNVNSTLSVDDCSVAEGRAQGAAIADARARARRVASAADLKLGAILAVNESASFPNPGCGNVADVYGQRGSDNGFGPLDVPVSVTATVTFATGQL
ncbi:MAG: SIMPL domain-containing protein [Candidatus Baltobacteraceae bacterium]